MQSPPILSLDQLALACGAGRADALRRSSAHATELPELDAALPGGGWPVGAVTEILSPTHGVGELRIVMPALARLTHAERYVAFIEPPYLPYPPALAQHGLKLARVIMIRAPQSLWANEQLLRCSALGAALTWLDAVNDKAVRRLQLAAEASGALAFLYRPASSASHSSPAALRLLLHVADDGVRVEIKKCRGGRAGQIVRAA